MAPDQGFLALALGHVVLARTDAVLEAVRAHELVHVRQAERWGPFFLPAYVCASVSAWAEGGRAYIDNVFEREARTASGHTTTVARRSLGV